MRRRSENKTSLPVAFAAILAACSAAGAASLTNKDDASQTIVVTEGGVKTEFAIAAGETVKLCDDGCFLTLPSGDRAALGGEEAVDIVNGEAVVE